MLFFAETDMFFRNIIQLSCTRNIDKLKDYLAVLTNHKGKHVQEMRILEELGEHSDDELVLDDEESNTIYRNSPFFKRCEMIAYDSLSLILQEI